MMDSGKKLQRFKKSDLNSQLLTHFFSQPQYGLEITVVDH